MHTDLPGALEARSLLEASRACKKSQAAGPQKASGSLRKPREASKKSHLSTCCVLWMLKIKNFPRFARCCKRVSDLIKCKRTSPKNATKNENPNFDLRAGPEGTSCPQGQYHKSKIFPEFLHLRQILAIFWPFLTSIRGPHQARNGPPLVKAATVLHLPCHRAFLSHPFPIVHPYKNRIRKWCGFV